ncbi:MAG TPA: hypothetical protein VJ853_12350 [Thermoanaerobaculia bacterium]|nr:hypothetical protein [Thermoanaerobaculia bacterium]
MIEPFRVPITIQSTLFFCDRENRVDRRVDDDHRLGGDRVRHDLIDLLSQVGSHFVAIPLVGENDHQLRIALLSDGGRLPQRDFRDIGEIGGNQDLAWHSVVHASHSQRPGVRRNGT